MIAGFLGIVYYFYTGIERSMEEVDSIEAQRTAAQPAARPSPGLSRSQAEQQRAGSYADAVKNSPSLNAHQKRVEDTEKAVQQISNSSR
jgi:hypothetical protein